MIECRITDAINDARLRSLPRKARRGLGLICEALRLPKNGQLFICMQAGAFQKVLRSAVWDRGSFLPTYPPGRFATDCQSFHFIFVKSGSNASRTCFSPGFSASSKLLNMPPIRNRNSNLQYATNQQAHADCATQRRQTQCAP